MLLYPKADTPNHVIFGYLYFSDGLRFQHDQMSVDPLLLFLSEQSIPTEEVLLPVEAAYDNADE